MGICSKTMRGDFIARPEKKRKVCSLPKKSKFIAVEKKKSEESIVMTVDEFETIRLIDYMGLTQVECAEYMRVGRATVQRIYSSARYKLSKLIVDGSILCIKGGEYEVCNGSFEKCNKKYCIDKNK